MIGCIAQSLIPMNYYKLKTHLASECNLFIFQEN